MWRLLAVMFCTASVGLIADVTDSATGQTFPSEITVNFAGKDLKLKATGVATRKKFFVKVYSVASYIQDDAKFTSGDLFQQILQADKAKQLTMKWVHDASAAKIKEGYTESFHKVFSDADFAKFQGLINQYLGFFSRDLVKGDEVVIRWFADGTVSVAVNGSDMGSLKDNDFARGLWNMWFGPKSVVDRNSLVSLIK